MSHDVFISYSSKDKPIADGICANLEAAGIRCWVAPRDIGLGEDRPTAIANAISKSRVMVLVFSAHSNASDDVSHELYLAANNKVVIIPFKIEDIKPAAGKAYYLGRTHWLDAMNPPTKQQIELLVKTVQPLLATIAPLADATTLPSGPAHTVPPRPKSILRNWIGVALVAFVVLVGGWFVWQTATPNATRTSVPSRTITPSAADQVRAFAGPIFAAIANRPPNFQDDFSNDSSGWEIFPPDQPGYVDGELSIVVPPAATGSNGFCYGASFPKLPESSDLVLEIDGQADLGSQADWMVQFRLSQNEVRRLPGYGLEIDPNGDLRILRFESQQVVNLLQGYKLHRPSDGNHVRIIAKGSRIAISANGEPIALVIDPQPLQGGGVALLVCNQTSTQAEARFDNLKIWDISDLPSPP